MDEQIQQLRKELEVGPKCKMCLMMRRRKKDQQMQRDAPPAAAGAAAEVEERSKELTGGADAAKVGRVGG
jgi:hypothetical protein